MTKVDHGAFRRALGSFPTGVTVVTARGRDGRDVGVTANSFNSVSLDPPMVLWSLKRDSVSLASFTNSGGFAVHILAADQQTLSDRFAARGTERFAGLVLERGYGEAPLLSGCAARFQCRLAFRYEGGDHEILVGEVMKFDHLEKAPLVYHGGRYGALGTLKRTGSEDDPSGPGELMQLVSRAYHRLFRDTRREIARRELSEEAYYVLRVLGNDGEQSFEQLARKVSKAGRELTRQTLEQLVMRAVITPRGDNVFDVTPQGRQTMLELAAMRLAAEEAAILGFDRSEVDLMKELLRRLWKPGSTTRSST